MTAGDLVESSYSDPQQKARFLAAASPHCGDWLLALSITACGLRLSDEAVRVAVALRLGCSVCVPHSCRCGSLVDAQGLHGLVCKLAPSRIIWYHTLNDVVARATQSAGIPVTNEPVGLTRLNGKRPNGLTLIAWQGGKPISWDVTVVSTLAASYLLVLPALQQTSLPVVKRRNIRASPTRIFSVHLSRISRCFQCKCPLLPHHFGRIVA